MSDTSPWEILLEDGGAQRTDLAAIGGDTVEEEAPFPDPIGDWTAKKANAYARELAAHARVVPMATVCVEYSGGTPVVVTAVGPGAHVVGGLFTPTDHGDGDVTLTWPEGALPVPVARPKPYLNGDTVGMICAQYVAVSGVMRSVRVRAKNGANTAANLPFTVDLH
ncbi:MAG: hypothetical protein WKG00_03340 [Polyangiaceae bacterium]